MEQQGSLPCTSSITRRDTSHSQDERLSLSEPAVTLTPQHTTSTTTSAASTSNPTPATPTAALTSTRDPLSTSEPTLRFPRPQGNRHLANWISSSDPDIMRVTSTEDTGLTESTYELISGTDTESQDGNYTESMGESVGSLDFHRPDDVHSIADTEQTFDDDSVADGLEQHTRLSAENQDDDDDDDEHDPTALSESLRTRRDSTRVYDPDHYDDADSESEDDARSRSSLEYTQQSLKTPSIPTPEASKIVDRPADLVDHVPAADEGTGFGEAPTAPLKGWFSRWYKNTRDREVQAWNFLRQTGFSIPSFILLLIALLIPAFISISPPLNLHSPAATAVITTHPTTTTLSTSQASTTSWALSTSTVSAELVPLENVQPDEWLFGGKKPDLAVFKQQHGNFLVRIPQNVKQTWLTKKCLMFSATRALETVPIGVSVAEDGMLIKFPQDEAHGSVQVEITALCRPKIHQVFRITFEKGIVEGALERTKHLAQDLTDLVPVAAQEAERRLEEARRSLESASDNVLTASDSLFKNVLTRFHNAHGSLSFIKVGIRDSIQNTKQTLSNKVDSVTGKVTKRLNQVQDIQDQVQLNVLETQISARLWWLKVTRNKKEHDRYQSKAQEFMTQKKSDAYKISQSRHSDVKPEKEASPGLWNKVFRGSRCGNKLGLGKRGMQQCNFVV